VDDGSDNEIVMNGKDCTTDNNAANCNGKCTVLKRTLCFDKTEQDQRYDIFKDYLMHNIVPGI